MSPPLRRSQPAIAAAAAATLKRSQSRRALSCNCTSSQQGRHVKNKERVAAAAAAVVQQLRHAGSSGGGGGRVGDRDPLGRDTTAVNRPKISGAGRSPQSSKGAPRVLRGKEMGSKAVAPTTTAATTTAEGGGRGRGGEAPSWHSAHNSRSSSSSSSSQNCNRPPLFYSSATNVEGTKPPPLIPQVAPLPSSATTATTAATTAMACAVSLSPARQHPREGTTLDYAGGSPRSSSAYGSRGGGGGRSGGAHLGVRHSRVFSSLPADNNTTSSTGGRQQQPTPPPQQQQQEQPPPPPPLLSPRITAADEELLASLSVQEATPLSLRDIHAFCQSTTASSRVLQARFLHREVPIRFAKRSLELRHLPYGLSNTAPVVEAVEWYARIMRELVACPVPDGPGGDQEFADFLSSLLMDHTCVPQALSRGVLELQEKGGVGLIQRHRIDRILDNFFISRISLRFLVDTYISSKKNKPGFSGLIESECSPVLVAWRAAADVDRLCRLHMGTAPAIEVFGRSDDTFTAVPSHLYYILREVLKNSCRATVEHGRLTRPGKKLPPVKIIVARGNEDMTIKIMDEGGGIRRSDLQRVWSYMYSTAPKPTASQLTGVPLDHMSGMRLKEEEAALLSNPKPDPGTTFAFAGFGMGLPLSRLYARYFGGSLKLRPMEGYGTDAYIHLHRLRTNSEELLPNSLEETLRVMADDGRVNVARSRSWKQPASNDAPARELIRSFGKGL